MRSTQSRLRGLAGIAAGTLVVTTLSAAPTHADDIPEPAPNIELQARSNLLVNDEGWNLPPGSSFNSITTALNDQGRIAFPVQIATYPGSPTTSTAAVWLGEGGEGDLVHRLPVNSPISASVHINESGDVAFTAGEATSNTPFVYDAALGEARQVNTMPVRPTSYSLGGIDEDQNIGFQGNFAGDRAFAAVIDGTGVWYAQDDGLDPESPFSYLYSATFNDAQQIAAKVSLTESFNHQQIRIFEADGSSQVVLASNNVDPDSPYRSFDNSVGLADDGTVAAFATLAAGGKVLVRTDGTETVHVADTSADSPIASFDFFAPDVNTRGEVVFRGVDKDGKKGVFIADGETIRPVLLQGDVVTTDLGRAQLGQHDTSPIYGGGPQINNRGDVSITAGVHPEGNNQVEWGTGVFIAYADTPVEPPVEEPIEVERWEGGNRYGTAAAVSATYEPGVDVVFLATGRDYPDALTGSALAGALDVPVLLTRPDALPTSTTAELERLAPEQVIVLGGDGVVADAVLEEAADLTGAPVDRLFGKNRYGTAAAVAAEFGSTGERVFVAVGLDYPDALSAAARAGALGSPVLLVRPDEVPSATAAALDDLAPSQITILGGEGVVHKEVMEELTDWAPTTRIAGGDRWITSALLFGEVAAADTVYLASGQDWPDALAGGAKAGSDHEPLLITRKGGLPSAITEAIVRLFPDKVVVLGGTGAVADTVVEELENLRGQD